MLIFTGPHYCLAYGSPDYIIIMLCSPGGRKRKEISMWGGDAQTAINSSSYVALLLYVRSYTMH